MATEWDGAGDRLSSEQRLWQRYARERDQAAREELVRRHLPFAHRLAFRYRAAAEPFDDLLQVASLGLVDAIDRFDPQRGIPFIAFATPTILGELRRYFRDRSWTIRLPRGLHDLAPEVKRAIPRLTSELQRSPSVGEIASWLEVELEDVLEVLEAMERRRPLSLDRPLGDEEGADPAEQIGRLDASFALTDDRLTLQKVLPILDEREKVILRLRFVSELTQSEIARRLGYSQMHVSRLLRTALERLRKETEV